MTPGHGSKHARRAEAAILALLTEPSIEAAADRAGVSKSTLLRWQQEPSFRDQYRAARRSVVEGTIGRLQQATAQAVDALCRNLTCGVPPSEIAAAKAIIDQAIKGVELVDLAERVDALEQAAEAMSPKGRPR
jgi:hypothetical protein